MSIMITPLFRQSAFAKTGMVFRIRRYSFYLLAIGALLLSANADAVPANYVALFIKNDLNPNNKIAVAEGSAVKVGWEVMSDDGTLLNKNDKIQLRLLEDDSVIDSAKRGKGVKGTVSLKVAKASGKKMYVVYIARKTGEEINLVSHPDGSDTTELSAYDKPKLGGLAGRVNTLEQASRYNIGDTGPAGGIVFYVTDDGLHGLEAAPADLSGMPEWGCMSTELFGADGARLGWGAANTADILRGCGESGIAAELADMYEMNGYYDWYLPSRDELGLIRQTIGHSAATLGNIGNFDSIFYWSSTEVDDANAWALRFSDNFSQALNKFDTLRLARAIRSF